MTEFSDLPEDLIVKIWSFLPAKSVLKLKSVQKSWNVLVNALVKTPSFVADHLGNSRAIRSSLVFTTAAKYSKSEKKQKFVTIHSDGDITEVLTDPVKVLKGSSNRDRTISANCDGITCTLHQESTPAATLWNPATGEIKRLEHENWGENIAVGFGYDSISRAYKLVVFHRLETMISVISAKVCTVREDYSWREVETDAFADLGGFNPLAKSGVCCGGGVICWIGRFGVNEKVVSFDMNTERFELVSIPSEVDHPWITWVGPRVLSGCLRVISDKVLGNLRLARWMGSVALLDDSKGKSSLVDVWVISEKNKSWIKRFTFSKPSDDNDKSGLVFHDVLENKYMKICDDEIVNNFRLVPNVEDYNFVALP